MADNGTVSTAGGTAIANVRSNDTINGIPATSANTTIAAQGIWPAGLSMNTSAGTVDVAAGTAAGTYSMSYQLCDSNAPSNCKTAIIVVSVNAAGATPIIAAEDSASVSPTQTGPVIPNIRSNDSLNGAPATNANTTVSVLGNWPAGVTLDPSGAVIAANPLPTGTHVFQYQLCEAAQPTNCTTANVRLIVLSLASIPSSTPTMLWIMAIALFALSISERKRARNALS